MATEKKEIVSTDMAVENKKAVSSPIGINLPSVHKPKSRGLFLLTTIGVIIGTTVSVGYNVGVIYSSGDLIMKSLNESQTTIDGDIHIIDTAELEKWFSAVVSSFFTGGCVGSIAGVWIGDRFGPKNSLIYCYTMFIVAALMLEKCADFRMFHLLLAGRFVAGIASGLATSILPIYLADVAPLKLHGTLVASAAIGVSSGVVSAQAMSLPELLGTKTTWGLVLSVYVFATIVGLLLLAFAPESPKYIHVITRRQKDKRVICRLRSKNNETLQADVWRRAKLRSLYSMLKDSTLYPPMAAIFMVYSLQFVLWVINAVVYYSSMTFKPACMDAIEVERGTLRLGCLQFSLNVFSVLIVHLFFRRWIVLISLYCIALTLIQPVVYLRFALDAESPDFFTRALSFAIAIINLLPMLLHLCGYHVVCGYTGDTPNLEPITSMFFLFCLGMSFVSMHSFVGGGFWLWTILFFGYFVAFCTFELLRLRPDLTRKAKKQYKCNETNFILSRWQPTKSAQQQ